MTVTHLRNDAGGSGVAARLARDGCVIVDELVDEATMDALLAEMAPFIDANAVGPDGFSGRHTRRTGGLVARSETARDLVMHPTVRDAVGQVLSKATNHQLHLTQVISIGPGQEVQPVHRDRWAFDFFPFGNDYEVTCNTMWAATDFTEANGATRVIVGSHRYDDGLSYGLDDTEPAEMTKGSALFYTGSLYHGGGGNRTDAVRHGVNITYAVAWLRQEENQYLSVPPEVACDLPVELLRLIGYERGAYALGYVDDLRHPLAVLGVDAEVGFTP